MIICKSEPRISFGTQQQPYLFLSYLKNRYCFCLKLKKKPQNTHFQVYENFEFYSKKIEKNDFPCLEIMSILLGKCKIRKSKLYSYRLLSHCAVQCQPQQCKPCLFTNPLFSCVFAASGVRAMRWARASQGRNCSCQIVIQQHRFLQEDLGARCVAGSTHCYNLARKVTKKFNWDKSWLFNLFNWQTKFYSVEI